MGQLYSHRLWQINVLGLTPVYSPTVPAGNIWVIRDIDITCLQAGPYTYVFQAWFAYPDGTYFWMVADGKVRGSTTYSWRGRQVLNAGERLSFNASVAYWQGGVSGYVLTTP